MDKLIKILGAVATSVGIIKAIGDLFGDLFGESEAEKEAREEAREEARKRAQRKSAFFYLIVFAMVLGGALFGAHHLGWIDAVSSPNYSQRIGEIE